MLFSWGHGVHLHHQESRYIWPIRRIAPGEPFVVALQREPVAPSCGCNCGCMLLNTASVSSTWKWFSVRARLL